jgi:hypothetical protein
MKSIASALWLLGVGFLLTGCASFAKRLEVSSVSKIQPGITTRTEVEARFGHPKETVLGSNGKTVVRYSFHEFHRSTDVSWNVRRFEPGQILFRTLTLKYGSSNIAEQKLHDESLTPIHRTNAWFFAGPGLTPESVAFIHPKSTTEADAVAKFGPPAARTFNGEGRSVLIWFSVKTRETTWSDPDIQKLTLLLDEGRVIRDFVLVEHAVSVFEPLTLH